MEKKRKYIKEYINLGFTSLLTNGVEKPQCVLCHVVLSAKSLKPSKLKRHLETKHPQHAKKDAAFFMQHLNAMKLVSSSNGLTLLETFIRKMWLYFKRPMKSHWKLPKERNLTLLGKHL